MDVVCCNSSTWHFVFFILYYIIILFNVQCSSYVKIVSLCLINFRLRFIRLPIVYLLCVCVFFIFASYDGMVSLMVGFVVVLCWIAEIREKWPNVVYALFSRILLWFLLALSYTTCNFSLKFRIRFSPFFSCINIGWRFIIWIS